MRKGRSHRKRMPRPSMSPSALGGLDAARSTRHGRDEDENEQRVVSILPPPALEIAADSGPSSDAAVVVAQTGALPAITIEEESVPPVGDLAVVEKFFSEGDLGAHVVASARDDMRDVLDEITAEKTKAKLAPHVVHRRARFVRVVTWVAGAASALCLVAVMRTVLAPHADIAPVAPARAAVFVAPEPAAAPAAKEAPKEEAKPEPVAATPAPKDEVPKDEPKVEVPNAAKPAVETAANALAEKNAARSALERGRLTEAIQAGERSVAADPSDGEAWLLLGAAYQERGKIAEARRCYAACVKEGKRGPKGECAAMLQ